MMDEIRVSIVNKSFKDLKKKYLKIHESFKKN
jgi:queuine/archaeosine tRNA-ribosyltransferase